MSGREHEYRVRVRVTGEFWVTVTAPDFEGMKAGAEEAYLHAAYGSGYGHQRPEADGPTTVTVVDWSRER